MNSAKATILHEDQIFEELTPIEEINSLDHNKIEDLDLLSKNKSTYATTNAVISSGKTKLEISLSKLSQLIANITEAYTAVIFVADTKEKVLHPLAYHSLSRDFTPEVKIPFGHGLVGWTAENKVRIAVCPFDKDARTLLYYNSEQNLKSFISVPILSKSGELVGVISCDSKKNYAFPKITEKVLSDCASQAEILIDLHTTNEELSRKAPKKNIEPLINLFNATLADAKNEYQLFESALKLPEQLIIRDGISCFVTSNEGFGEPKFYTSAKDKRSEQYLVDLICKHKKIKSLNKDLLVLPNEEIKSRSFLSAPFSVFGIEAGTISVLGAPFSSFSPEDISNLEKVSKQIGLELEYLRLKDLTKVRQIGPSMLPWKHFISKIIEDSKDLNKSGVVSPSLLRIQLEDLQGLEVDLGVLATTEILDQMLRYAQQLSGSGLLVSAPYGTTIFVYGEENSVSMVGKRISNLLCRVDNTKLSSSKASSLKISESVSTRLKIDLASCLNNKANGIQTEESIILSRLSPLVTRSSEKQESNINENTAGPVANPLSASEKQITENIRLSLKSNDNNFSLGARKKNEELRDKFWK